MATRDENLKKINDTLEQLSDEELTQVAGGNMAQTSDDSALLYAYGLLDDYHGSLHMTFHWKSDSAAVDKGWAKAGITCVTVPGSKVRVSNRYFLDGKEISRDQAHDYLKANFNQIREIPD